MLWSTRAVLRLWSALKQRCEYLRFRYSPTYRGRLGLQRLYESQERLL